MELIRRKKTIYTKEGVRLPGIEPGSITWQATILAIKPQTHLMVQRAIVMYQYRQYHQMRFFGAII